MAARRLTMNSAQFNTGDRVAFRDNHDGLSYDMIGRVKKDEGKARVKVGYKPRTGYRTDVYNVPRGELRLF